MRAPLITSLLLVASSLLLLGANQETLEQLKQRAAAAGVREQPRLFLEVADRQLKTASDAYHQGRSEDGQASVVEVAAYCEKAAAAASSSHKDLKRTEIKIRDMSHRLAAMLRLVSFEEREPMQAALARMEKARSDLLSAMFGVKS